MSMSWLAITCTTSASPYLETIDAFSETHVKTIYGGRAFPKYFSSWHLSVCESYQWDDSSGFTDKRLIALIV